MGKFALDLTRFANKYKDRIDVVVQKLTIDIFGNVILITPVDKGRARMNWTAGDGMYSTSTVDGFDRSGSESISNMSSLVSKTKAGGIVYLVNNLPYIRRLEYDGWSSQAPAGMVRVTIAEFQDYVAKAARDIR